MFPVTFYDQMSAAEVEADIRRGHETVTKVMGEAPRGFRAPHFGSFQSPNQLALIYRVVRDLGYRVLLDHHPTGRAGSRAAGGARRRVRAPAVWLLSGAHHHTGLRGPISKTVRLIALAKRISSCSEIPSTICKLKACPACWPIMSIQRTSSVSSLF